MNISKTIRGALLSLSVLFCLIPTKDFSYSSSPSHLNCFNPAQVICVGLVTMFITAFFTKAVCERPEKEIVEVEKVVYKKNYLSIVWLEFGDLFQALHSGTLTKKALLTFIEQWYVRNASQLSDTDILRGKKLHFFIRDFDFYIRKINEYRSFDGTSSMLWSSKADFCIKGLRDLRDLVKLEFKQAFYREEQEIKQEKEERRRYEAQLQLEKQRLEQEKERIAQERTYQREKVAAERERTEAMERIADKKRRDRERQRRYEEVKNCLDRERHHCQKQEFGITVVNV